MSSTAPPSVSRKSTASQWSLLALVLVALGVVMAGAQWRDYLAIDRAEREQLRTQTRVADELLTSQIESADAALRTMLESMERWRAPDSSFEPFAHEHLQRVAKMMPGARTFAVFDPQGVCQLSNRTELLGVDFSGRAYFLNAAADTKGALLHVSPPYRTVTDIWTVTISRAIIRPDGQFGGVVSATLSPGHFGSLLTDLRYAIDMRVTLMHDQGAIYVTSPPGLAIQDSNQAGDGTFFAEHKLQGLPESEHVGTGLDGRERMAVTHTIGLENLHATHGFVAVASRELGEVYASWRDMTSVLFGLWLVFACLSAWGLARYRKGAARLRKKAALAEQAMRYSNQRFEQLAQTIPCMLYDFEVSASGQAKVTYVGPYSQTLLGLAPELLLDDYDRFIRCIHEEDRPSYQAARASAINNRVGYECEFRIMTPAGERWVKSSATPGTSVNGAGITHFSGFVFDITDIKKQQLQLRDMAYQDPLTQADNRRSFIEKLQAEIARVQRYGEQAALLMIDIDFFKQVNDTYGHLVGDAALKHLVAMLQTGLRGVDSLGRLGGEEFAVLLPGTHLEAATQLAERLRLAVQNNPVIEAGQTVSFTISIGVVAITADTPDMKTVLHMADKAMYHAKQTGRNRVCTAAEAPDTTLQSALD